jgi:PHS family inorganic phosphate transporter-like MFS transporter
MQDIHRPQSPFEHLDRLKLTFTHIRIWYLSGAGFFTDAYDLFVISVILAVLSSYSIPGFEDLHGPNAAFWKGLLASAALWATIAGQLLFGRLGDRLGRKRIYGVEAAILTSGAILSAISPNLLWLVTSRIFLGFGIGGDYPISATIMSEYSNAKDRGKLVALVFASQGLGILASIGVALASVALLPPDLAWRVMLGAGAIPAASVIYLRRRIPETPRFALLVKGDAKEAQKAAELFGVELAPAKVRAEPIGVGEFLRSYWKTLVATTLPWFLMDITLYGTGVYQQDFINAVMGPAKTLFDEILHLGVPFMVGVPGYFATALLVDRWGRKPIQIMGFAVMGALYLAVSFIASAPSALAIVAYSLTYFFLNFGPNTTTFILPAELYPTRYRTTGHGISAAAGKLGAAISTFYFPTLINEIGVPPLLRLLAAISALGLVISWLFLVEPKMTSLEAISGERISLVLTAPQAQ